MQNLFVGNEQLFFEEVFPSVFLERKAAMTSPELFASLLIHLFLVSDCHSILEKPDERRHSRRVSRFIAVHLQSTSRFSLFFVFRLCIIPLSSSVIFSLCFVEIFLVPRTNRDWLVFCSVVVVVVVVISFFSPLLASVLISTAQARLLELMCKGGFNR